MPPQIAALPWYVKAFLSFGGLSMIWKMVQGGIPQLVTKLTPFAEKGADAFAGLILASPLIRWFVFGSRENVDKMISSVFDALDAVMKAFELRLISDIDQAAQQAEQPSAPPPAAPSSGP